MSNLRTVIEPHEALLIEAVVLAKSVPTSVTLMHRDVSVGDAENGEHQSFPAVLVSIFCARFVPKFYFLSLFASLINKWKPS